MEENPEPARPQQSDDEDWKKLLKQLMGACIETNRHYLTFFFVLFFFAGGGGTLGEVSIHMHLLFYSTGLSCSVFDWP